MAVDVLGEYEYTAIDSLGKKVSGTRTARSLPDVHDYLKRNRLTPVKVVSPEAEADPSTKLRGKLPSNEEIADFMRELSIFVGASISERDALAAILDSMEEGTRFYYTIVDVRRRIVNGDKIHEAMSVHQEVFSPGVTSALRSGYLKGKLATTLREIADRLEQENALARQVKKALTSPLLEIVALFLAMAFMVVFIVPQISDFYEQMAGEDAKLPAMTIFMVWLSGVLPYVLVPAVVLGVVAAGWYRRNKNRPEIKKKFDNFYGKIPYVGALLIEVALTRFCRDMSGNLQSGIEINHALTIASDTVNHAEMKEVLLRAAAVTENGDPMSIILDEDDLFPSTLVSMVRAGERSGRLPEMFEHLTRKYDESSKRKSDNLAAAIAPFTKIGMGLAVGFLAMAVLQPLFSVAGQVSV